MNNTFKWLYAHFLMSESELRKAEFLSYIDFMSQTKSDVIILKYTNKVEESNGNYY